jgi:HK97 family phage major capsid protein
MAVAVTDRTELRLPGGLATNGFSLETKTWGGREQEVIVGPSGRVFSEASTFCGPYDDDDLRKVWYQRAARWSVRREYGEGFWRYLSLVGKTQDTNLAFAMLPKPEQKALFESLDGSGGFWTPPTFAEQLLARLAEQSWALTLSSMMPCSSDRLVIPRFLPSSTNGSLYSSQIHPASVGESPSQASADPGFGSLSIPIRKFRSFIRISRDLLADAAYVEAALLGAFSNDVAAQIDAEVLGGPNFDALLTNLAIPQTSLGSGALGATSADSWRTLRSSLPGQYRDAARVVMSGTLQSAFEQLAPSASARPIATRHNDVTGTYVFDEIALQNSAAAPSYPSTGPVLVYGDLLQYTIATRADVTLNVITESDAIDTDCVDFVLWYRAGGAVANADGFRVGVL